jgi:histidyl-tRNA synthetase
MVRRNYIFDTIRTVFQRYGFSPIETPAMENIETLTGKYGDEGDQLLFKILNSRQFESKNKEELKKEYERSLEKNINSPLLTERALRYDLTVPFARYVVQHQNEITFPFKRYQIQPVWRADKPQKGRYREFFQCDADVIGSNSLLNEVEIVQMIDEVFSALGVSVTVKINNRKILTGIAEAIGETEKIIDITVAIDKLDKIGIDGVIKELKEKQVADAAIEKLIPLINLQLGGKNSNNEKLGVLISLLTISDAGKNGLNELQTVINTISKLNIKSELQLDITLARGLNYYTGAIFEVKANDVQMGSICGGGRYDDLTGIFGLPNMSGVGISFGIDRIFDVMNDLNLFDKINNTSQTTKLMFAHFGEAERDYCIALAAKARTAGINTEIYPDAVKKISKQFDYANKKNIPYVAVVGGDEMQTGIISLKDMAKGEQEKLAIDAIIKKLNEHI